MNELCAEAFDDVDSMVGDLAKTDAQQCQVGLLLLTWKHWFVADVRDMSPTSLIKHSTPTFRLLSKPGTPALYTAAEVECQKKHFPALEDAGIIVLKRT